MPRKKPTRSDYADDRSCRIVDLSKRIAELHRRERSLNKQLLDHPRKGATGTETRAELARILESIEQLITELRKVEDEP